MEIELFGDSSDADEVDITEIFKLLKSMETLTIKQFVIDNTDDFKKVNNRAELSKKFKAKFRGGGNSFKHFKKELLSIGIDYWSLPQQNIKI